MFYLIRETSTMSICGKEPLDGILVQGPLTTLEEEDLMDALAKDFKGYITYDIDFWDNVNDEPF